MTGRGSRYADMCIFLQKGERVLRYEQFCLTIPRPPLIMKEHAMTEKVGIQARFREGGHRLQAAPNGRAPKFPPERPARKARLAPCAR